jgi:PIN domain nuclease of toxin-antitoxin system
LILVSAASVWEIAIKHGLARGRVNDMPVSASDALGFFRAAGYELLAVTAEHAAAVAALPSLHATRLIASSLRRRCMSRCGS